MPDGPLGSQNVKLPGTASAITLTAPPLNTLCGLCRTDDLRKILIWTSSQLASELIPLDLAAAHIQPGYLWRQCPRYTALSVVVAQVPAGLSVGSSVHSLLVALARLRRRILALLSGAFCLMPPRSW